MSGWFGRKESRAKFLSLAPADMYLGHYAQHLVTDSVGTKVGVAAAVTLFTQAADSYNQLFFVVLTFWAGDMLFGTLRALRDRRVQWRWAKAGDGFLRLIVILVLPPIVRIAELAPAGLFNLDPNMRLVIFVLSIMAVHEFLSLLDNAAALYPAVEKVRAKLIVWKPGEEAEEKQVRVLMLDEKSPPKGGE